MSQLTDAGLTVAVAESLTGGAVCTRLSGEPGSSRVFRGGVVAYTVAAKESILGVDAGLLASVGPVDGSVARAMASSVASLFEADIGVSTTGVAGPDPHGGHPPGDVFLGWWSRGRGGAVQLRVPGDRGAVVRTVADRAVALVRQLAATGTPDPTALGGSAVATS